VGMVQRSIAKKANQRVAEGRILEVECGPAAVHEAVRGLLETWNNASDAAFEARLETKGRFGRWVSSNSSPRSRHYFSVERPGHLMVTFGVTATRVVERGFNPADRGWIARIEPAGSSPDGRALIKATLARWVTNDAGLIWNGDSYVQMLDGLVANLDGRYVSAPVAEEDHRFVRYG
jgi:hypothetical protein